MKSLKLHQPLSKESQEWVAKGAIFFVSHSGGKDSQAQYLYLRDKIPADQLVIIHADLHEVEWEGVQDHIRATTDGKEIHVVKGIRSFIEMVRKRGMFPSPQRCQGTNDLKIAPINKFIIKYLADRGLKYGVNCTGIRAQESLSRSCNEPFSANKKLTLWIKESKLVKGKMKRVNTATPNGKRFVHNWHPIFDWSVEDVFMAIKASGQRPHWAYEKGMSRLSCAFCIQANKSDLRTSAKINKELFVAMVSLEKEIGFTMFSKTVKGEPVKVSLEEFIGYGSEDYENHQAPNLFEMLTANMDVKKSA